MLIYRNMLLFVFSSLFAISCAQSENGLIPEESSTGSGRELDRHNHARDIFDIMKDFTDIDNNKSTLKKKVKCKVKCDDRKYYDMYNDKISTAGTHQRIAIIKRKIDNKVIYEQVFSRMGSIYETTERIAVIKNRKTEETESLTFHPMGIWGKVKNEEMVYEILKGLYKKYRPAKKTDPQAADVPVILDSGFLNQRKLDNIEGYDKLKLLVFEKMGAKFVATFNMRYPQPSHQSLDQLALHIDSITDYQRWGSARVIAVIGSQKIHLKGVIARAVYKGQGGS